MTLTMKAIKYARSYSAFFLFVCALLALFLHQPAYSQEATEAPVEAVDGAQLPDEVLVAPVIIDGETLFLVRGSSALPASERAQKIQERIISAAESSDEPNVATEIRNVEFGREISIDGRMVTIAITADAEFEQMDIDVVAGLQAEAIEAAISAYRAERTNDARVESTLAALGWTAAFLALSFAFFKLRRRLSERAAKFTESRFERVEEATASIVQGSAVANLVSFGVQIVLWIAYLTALYYYLSFVLLAFAETRAFAEILLKYVSEPLIDVLTGFVAYIPNLITLAIIVVVTRYCVRALKLFFENIEAGTFKLREFETHWIAPTFFLGRILIYMVALVFAYPFIPGSDSVVFQALTILAGVMVSLGSNTVVSNLMAGLFVIYRRSTNVGDRIKVGDQVGDVVEIKLMETMLKSTKNEMISIPNSLLLNSEVVNYSRKIDGRGILVHTTVGIGYEEPQEKIEAMLIEAARRTNGLKKSPEPFVLWTALADYAINYQVNAFTTRGSSLPKLLSDLHKNIVTVFNENEVQIMTPSYESDPEIPKVGPVAWSGELARSE